MIRCMYPWAAQKALIGNFGKTQTGHNLVFFYEAELRALLLHYLTACVPVQLHKAFIGMSAQTNMWLEANKIITSETIVSRFDPRLSADLVSLSMSNLMLRVLLRWRKGRGGE